MRRGGSPPDLSEIWADSRAVPVLPVVGAVRAEHAPALTAAFAGAGVPAVEITLRASGALAAVRAAAAAGAGVVGVGTVCTVAQLDAALEAGAAFAVSPGFDPDLTRHALTRRVPYLPGVTTASEVMAARALGLRLLKFFPADAMGGVAALRALGGPFPDVAFVPSGGIDAANLRAYLRLPNVVAAGGSWLVTEDELMCGDFARVAQRVDAARGAAGMRHSGESG